jgi:hypothetical protein
LGYYFPPVLRTGFFTSTLINVRSSLRLVKLTDRDFSCSFVVEQGSWADIRLMRVVFRIFVHVKWHAEGHLYLKTSQDESYFHTLHTTTKSEISALTEEHKEMTRCDLPFSLILPNELKTIVSSSSSINLPQVLATSSCIRITR